MRPMTAISSLFIGAVLILAGFTPVLASKPGVHYETVPVKVTRYFGETTDQTETLVTPAQAEQITTLLTRLAAAQDQHDTQTQTSCLQALQQLGIDVGPYYLRLMQQQSTLNRLESLRAPIGTGLLDDNISNSMCLFNAIGQGLMVSYVFLNIIKQLFDAINNVSNPLGAVILLIILLPIIVIALLFNDIIPFRVMMPQGSLILQNGTIASRGTEGHKRVQVGANSTYVNLSGFSGLAINIPGSDTRKSFTWTSGFALKVEQVGPW